MPDFEKLQRNLTERGFAVSRFATGREAVDYLSAAIQGKTVGVGGSMTLKELNLEERLEGENTILSHWSTPPAPAAAAATADVYLCSCNGVAETGELINIDGCGNRVASTAFGHEDIYFVVGVNKIAPDFETALWRARNIAGPKNAQRLNRATPCAAKGDRCYDCKSPERICRALMVLWEKPTSFRRAEVVLVEEPLGY